MPKKISEADTINDFGNQWNLFDKNQGYYASTNVLNELISPLLPIEKLRGMKIADVGAGSGRYTLMLNASGAAHVDAIEPSNAYDVLIKNVAHLPNINCLRLPADQIPLNDYDLVFCVGVLQFIADDKKALMAMGRSLGKKGQLFLWVYGRENNGLYLSFIKPIRFVSSRLSAKALDVVCNIILLPTDGYSWLCRKLPFGLPMSKYIKSYFSKMDRYSRKLIIFNELNPTIAKYYRKKELLDLLQGAGFVNISMHHHHKYSWSVLASFSG